MVRYPYTLYAIRSTEAERLPNGDYAPGELLRVEIGPCRDESVGAGTTVTLEDGTAQVVSSVVFMPMGFHPNIQAGQTVEVSKAGVGVRLRGVVKRVEVSQLSMRLWL